MTKATDVVDERHMRAALTLAARGLGQVAPNPAVGCVVVRDGYVAGRGWTQPGGRPHAETEALRRAGEAARGATAYVSLEPCSHHGKTPPCAEALIAAGIARVVVATEDPDPRVSGAGVTMLREAGIEVTTGVCEPAARYLNLGFWLHRTDDRPLVTLKLATSLDGRIATAGGISQWITALPAREAAHLLRARHDAILVGTNTAIADDPELSCRLPGLERRSPLRVVLDARLRLPLTHRLVRDAGDRPTLLFTRSDAEPARRRAFADCGVEVAEAELDANGRLDLAGVMRTLAERGITRLMVEGGGHVAADLLAHELVDRIAWFRAAGVMGDDGIAGIGALGLERPDAMPRFRRVEVRAVGDDLLETYRRETR